MFDEINEKMIADVDTEVSHLLKEYFEQEDMTVHTAAESLSAIETLKIQVFDSLLNDVMTPKLNGFDTLKALRLACDIAILMLKEKGESIDRHIGLEMAVNDCPTRTCEPGELIARIRAVTAASLQSKPNKSDIDVVNLDNLTLIKTSRQVMLDHECLVFTSAEFDLLLLLIDKAGEPVSRDTLSQYGRLQAHGRSVDVHINNLRRKLGPDSQGRKRIKNIRGIGYQYVIYPIV